MKLVKDINTNLYSYIDDAQYDTNIHIDRTNSIMYWRNFFIEANVDHLTAQFAIKSIYDTNGWSSFKNIEKDVLIWFGIGDPSTEIIPYLMTEYGMTQLDANGFYLTSMTKRQNRNIAVTYQREKHYILKNIVYSFVDTLEADNLLKILKDMLDLYKSKAYFGTMYGDTQDGVMDYIENTGSYATSSGLNTVNISQNAINLYGTETAAKTAFKNALVDWLIYQKYNGQYVFINDIDYKNNL